VLYIYGNDGGHCRCGVGGSKGVEAGAGIFEWTLSHLATPMAIPAGFIHIERKPDGKYMGH